jgi:hypothetical protein
MGRLPHWVKVKNPKAAAVKREADEDWGPSVIEFARDDSASLTRSDCGTMRDTVIFAAFFLLLILAVVLLARFIVP